MNPPKAPLAGMFLVAGWMSAAPAFAIIPSIPQPVEEGRYEALIENCPFTVATPPPAPAAPPPAPWNDFFVAGVCKITDSNGEKVNFVSLKSHSDPVGFSLTGTEPNKDGIAIAGVEMSEKAGNTKVTIKKGAEFATLEFDKANTPSTMPPPPAPNGMPRPLGAGMIPQRPAQRGLPPLPSPNPAMINGRRSANGIYQPIPRPGAPMTQPQPQFGNGQGNPPIADRRRPRVIVSKP